MSRTDPWWRLALVSALLLWSVTSAFAQGCPDNGADHERAWAKNRPAPAAGVVPLHDTTVAEVIAWPVPIIKNWRKGHPQMLVPGEDRIVRVLGYVQVAKLEADGDDHVEIADSVSKTAPRVIVEIPCTQPTARQQLADLLGFMPSTNARHPTTPTRLAFTGDAFLDLTHAAKDGNKKGHSHGSAFTGSIWEAHPVWVVEPAPISGTSSAR